MEIGGFEWAPDVKSEAQHQAHKRCSLKETRSDKGDSDDSRCGLAKQETFQGLL